MAGSAELEALLAPVVASQQCELWGLEYAVHGRRSTLRVYIDTPQGVTLEDCERVSRQISAVLDVEDPITSAYTLEVSSPGLDRPLYTASQFERYAGSRVSVRLRAPYEGRRRFNGLLKGLDDGDVVVQVEDTEYLLPLESIEKANVVPTFDGVAKANIAGAVTEGAEIDDEDLQVFDDDDFDDEALDGEQDDTTADAP